MLDGASTTSLGGKVRVRHRLAALLGVVGLTIPQSVIAGAAPLTVDLAAEIPARCGFSNNGVRGAQNAPDLERKGQVALRIRLDCNTPYAIGVEARSGSLANLDAQPDGSGYAFSKPYSLTLKLDTDKGQRVSMPCISTQLIAGGNCPFAASTPGTGFSSGDGISVGRDLTLSVEWSDQRTSGNRLAPGRYRDTLIIVIGARA